MSFVDVVRVTKVIGIKWDEEIKNAYQNFDQKSSKLNTASDAY